VRRPLPLPAAALALLLLPLTLSGCYAARMALHHNDLFNSRQPVQTVLASPDTPPKVKARLALVEEVMRYAASQGLRTEGAYRYFIETKNPVVSYLVQAAHADELKSVTWWFPVVGSVPYRGYFDVAERDAKAEELAAQGYDVYTSGAGAFSSLGWFEDPIFSSMLERGDAELAALFFHELTHRTFWAPGSTKFNENLAEYVSIELTEQFLAVRGDQKAIARYADKRADRHLFHEWLVGLKAEAEELFENAAGLDRPALLAAKAAMYERWQKPPLKPKFKVVDYVEGETWNNASLLGASLYDPDTDAFARAHQCLRGERIGVFLDALAAATATLGDPFEALESLCRS
jgi:predicted aminopeptidase